MKTEKSKWILFWTFAKKTHEEEEGEEEEKEGEIK